MPGERFDAPDMRDLNRQHPKAVGGHVFDNLTFYRQRKLELAQAGFDREFPRAEHADDAFVFRIGQDGTRFRRQNAVTFDPLQKYERIDKNAH